MSEPFPDALAAALACVDGWTLASGTFGLQAEMRAEAELIIATLPPEWRDYLAAREPLLALVAAAPEVLSALALTYSTVIEDERPHWCGRSGQHDATCRGMVAVQDTARAILADPAIVKLREAGRG